MNTYKKLLFVYILLIIGVSSIPGQAMPKSWFSWGWEDKIYHMIEYSVLGILAYLSYCDHVRYSFSLLVVSGFSFGLFDELYQSLIPGRFPNAFDVIADGIGVTLGSISTHYLRKVFND